MEARRQELVKQGYAIRKLNQAYFAFHGSYAVGTGATDPIGGKLRALRAAGSASLPDVPEDGGSGSTQSRGPGRRADAS